MGLTHNSVGMKAVDSGLKIKKQNESDRVIAIAGNPNVGKSTLFNALTGMNQHTGNWPGKTVANAQGSYQTQRSGYVLVDIPGTYSLMAHSAEEEIARNFICFGNPDAVVVVCDATCLERNLNLVLQTIEITDNVVVCVNLIDEAKRKGIKIDLEKLSALLGVPVVGTIARKKKTLKLLTDTLDKMSYNEVELSPIKLKYIESIEAAIAEVEPVIVAKGCGGINPRWLSLKLLDCDSSLSAEINSCLNCDILADGEIEQAIERGQKILAENGITADNLKDKIVACVVLTAEGIAGETVSVRNDKYNSFDRKLDKALTGKRIGYPIMILLLAFVFWLTITGANYPSRLLADGLFWVQDRLTDFFIYINAPEWLHGMIVLGIYRVLAWVVSVMLPPMAIFFPLFTLLEDVGYLPRIAYNLDKPFRKCNACGKQALTMAMGFGCNAAGVIGCRIIDSPRERLIAIVTNSLVPCNGRFPTIIAIITMFFVGTVGGLFNSLLSTLLLTAVIVLGILMTFAASRLLSKTLLKGEPSSFTLELPPYRRPQIGKVIVRSILDRTLFVLGRAAAVAAPAGLVIWIMANITVGDMSILNHCAAFLDPFASLFGLDGVILLAFILGFPANEIVVPIIIMAYMAQGSIIELSSIDMMKNLFVQNGWTWVTAICVILFSLLHWPCSTTLLTAKKETGSLKWTAVAFLLPTIIGLAVCFVVANTAKLFLI